jgi:hypothetical protein
MLSWMSHACTHTHMYTCSRCHACSLGQCQVDVLKTKFQRLWGRWGFVPPAPRWFPERCHLRAREPCRLPLSSLSGHTPAFPQVSTCTFQTTVPPGIVQPLRVERGGMCVQASTFNVVSSVNLHQVKGNVALCALLSPWRIVAVYKHPSTRTGMEVGSAWRPWHGTIRDRGK